MSFSFRNVSVRRELAVAYFVKTIVERGFKESKCTTLYLSLTFTPCISINYPCIMLQKFKLSNLSFQCTFGFLQLKCFFFTILSELLVYLRRREDVAPMQTV